MSTVKEQIIKVSFEGPLHEDHYLQNRTRIVFMFTKLWLNWAFFFLLLVLWATVVLSANSINLRKLDKTWISLIYQRKRKVPRIEPCGTLHYTTLLILRSNTVDLTTTTSRPNWPIRSIITRVKYYRDTTDVDSEDEYRTGFRNVSHCQQQQSYSGLRSPGRSYSTYLWNDSWVQTFHRINLARHDCIDCFG